MDNYIRHTIYCNLDYKTLASITADYFVSNGYYDYGTEEKFKNNWKIYDYVDSARFSVVFAKSLIDLSGSIAVSTENLKAKYSRGELKLKDLPLRIQQRFKVVPNILIIDLHKYYYQAQKKIVEDITAKLSASGYEVYDNSFNGQLLSVYDSFASEEERCAAIHELVYKNFEEKNLPNLNLQDFHSDLSLLVSNLSNDGLIVLKTAELLYTMELELPDYSPIVIEYCKLVEIEIYHKILYRLKIENQSILPASISNSNSIKKLKTFVVSTDNKPMELGTFAYLIEKIDTESIVDILSQRTRNIIKKLPFKLELKDLYNDIFYLTRNYRNKAAHKSILSKQDMLDCRKFVVGDNDGLGLISKLVSIG